MKRTEEKNYEYTFEKYNLRNKNEESRTQKRRMKRETSRKRTRIIHHHRHRHALFVCCIPCFFHRIPSPSPTTSLHGLSAAPVATLPADNPCPSPSTILSLSSSYSVFLLKFVIYVPHLHYDRRQNSHMDSGDAVYVK